MRIVYKLDDTIQIFRLGTTTNKKIAKPNEKMVQSYTFSIAQFNYVKSCVENNESVVLSEFYSLDSANCFDCPFSKNSGNGKCYTHKFTQYRGFVSMLKSMLKEYSSINDIPEYNSSMLSVLALMSDNRYVRFGTYGEPSLHPLEIVETMTAVAKTWTGYTHQYFRKPEYSKYFMASTHNERQAVSAKDNYDYRSFVALTELKASDIIQLVQCPASKESGFKSNCSDCGLCSGTNGKGNKGVKILMH